MCKPEKKDKPTKGNNKGKWSVALRVAHNSEGPQASWRGTDIVSSIPSIRKRKRSEVVSIDQPQRQSKRLQKCNDSTTIPAALLTPPSSILDLARSSSTRGLNGRREYTGSKFDLADALPLVQTGSIQSRTRASQCN
jgi:hypothetical protein